MVKAKNSPKKAPKTRAKHITKTETHFMLRRSLLVYAVLVFIFFWLATMSVYLVDRVLVERSHTAQYNQISQIYTSLNLDDSYRAARYSNEIASDKSATIELGHNTTISKTRDELTEKLKKSGFSLEKTENKDSIVQVDTFKDEDGNSIRLEIIPRALQTDYIYGTSTVATPYIKQNVNSFDSDPYSYVTLKISLDD